MASVGEGERFVVLETKVAYQEKLLSELSEVIREQSAELKELGRRLHTLERALREENDEGGSLPHERPPHY